MDWLPGGDWGFQEQVDNGNITAPVNLSLSAAEVIERTHRAEDVRNSRIAEAMQSHESYWNAHAPGSRFEYQRFAEGVSLVLLSRHWLTVFDSWNGDGRMQVTSF